jgi:hypothetical protein
LLRESRSFTRPPVIIRDTSKGMSPPLEPMSPPPKPISPPAEPMSPPSLERFIHLSQRRHFLMKYKKLLPSRWAPGRTCKQSDEIPTKLVEDLRRTGGLRRPVRLARAGARGASPTRNGSGITECGCTGRAMMVLIDEQDRIPLLWRHRFVQDRTARPEPARTGRGPCPARCRRSRAASEQGHPRSMSAGSGGDHSCASRSGSW